MKISRLLVAGLLVIALNSSIQAETKDEKQDRAQLLIGAWKVTTADRDAPMGLGDSTEFSKDGKNTTTRKRTGKEVVSQGTYKFEKEKLVITYKSEKGASETVFTIKKITDTELILSHDKRGKVIEFRKVQPPAAVKQRYPVPIWYGGLPRFSPGRFYRGGYPPGR